MTLSPTAPTRSVEDGKPAPAPRPPPGKRQLKPGARCVPVHITLPPYYAKILAERMAREGIGASEAVRHFIREATRRDP